MSHPQVCLPPGPPTLRQACSCRCDPDTLGNDSDTAVGEGEASGVIRFGVNTDLGAVGDHDILVQDRAMYDCVTPDDRMGQDHRMVHPCVGVYVDVGRKHRTLDGTT